MRKSIILFCLSLILSFTAFGQNEKYKAISESEIQLFNDLILSLNDNSFVISPLIEEKLDACMLNDARLRIKYGFTRNEFRNISDKTYVIRKNRYFEVANQDSLIKFSDLNHKMIIIDSTYTFYPYYYFLEKTYHKKCICTFGKTIFSKDRSYAIAAYFVACGPNDGRGKTILMRKKKNKWIIIEDLGYHGS